MVTDLNPPAAFAQLSAERATTPARHVLRTHAQSSYPKLSRAEREARFEIEHGSLWTPGLLDRLSLPLTRFRE
jgi:hypothetical protein